MRSLENSQTYLGPIETFEMKQNVLTLEEALQTFEMNGESSLFLFQQQKQGKDTTLTSAFEQKEKIIRIRK
jgi:hypothetical protein